MLCQRRVLRNKLDMYVVIASIGDLLIHEDTIRPVLSVTEVAWFIRYICYWNLKFLNNVIIIRINVFLLQT